MKKRIKKKKDHSLKILMNTTQIMKIKTFPIFSVEKKNGVFTNQRTWCNRFNLLVCVKDQTNHH